MKKLYGVFFLVFTCLLQAQQPPAAQQGFQFHKQMPLLSFISAQKAAESLAGLSGDEVQKRLSAFSEYQKMLIKLMLKYKTAQEKIGFALDKNSVEFLKLALFDLKVDEKLFIKTALAAIRKYRKPISDSSYLTPIEYLLARAQNIPQGMRDELLLDAHETQNIPLVRLLLYGGVIDGQYSIQGGARGSFVTQWDGFPLHKSIATGNLEGRSKVALDFLQQRNLDLEKRDLWWKDIEKDTLQAVREMLGAYATADALRAVVNQSMGPDLRTPLHLAAKYGNAEMVKLFLEAGARAEAKDRLGQTPLCRAMEIGDEETIKLLRLAWGKTPLHRAVERGDAKTVSQLLAFGAEIEAKDDEGRTPLHRAAKYCNTEPMKLLLEAGARAEAKDDRGRTPLHVAMQLGCEEPIKLLRLAWGKTPLYKAVERGDAKTVKILLKAGEKIETRDYFDQTPLHVAAGLGNAETVKLLLAAGAKTETKDDEGRTPLYLAAESSNAETVKLLLAAGAKTEAKDRLHGKTPLHAAAVHSDAEMVKLLLAAGAETEAKDRLGQTPLYRAADFGNAESVKLLLEAGAKTEAKDRLYGRTPLHAAAESDNVEIFKLLLEAGASCFTVFDHDCKPAMFKFFEAERLRLGVKRDNLGEENKKRACLE